jgi:hypothetical protein
VSILLEMDFAIAMSVVELLRGVLVLRLVLDCFDKTVMVAGEREKKGYDVKGFPGVFGILLFWFVFL